MEEKIGDDKNFPWIVVCKTTITEACKMLDNQPFGLCLLGRDPLQPSYHTANILQHLGLSLMIAQHLTCRDNIINGFDFSSREKKIDGEAQENPYT